MLIIFTMFADLIVYRIMGLSSGTHLAESIHFFVEEYPKYMSFL